MHTTNYTNTFIEVADDCPSEVGAPPPPKQPATVAGLQYALIHDQPYHYTSDDVLFAVDATRKGIAAAEQAEARAAFFARPQACLRSSPLGKRYGWGIHYDAEGKMAIYGRESAEYERLRSDSALKHLKAMRSSR